MMRAVGFIAVMAITYFVVPIAAPSVSLTLIQSAAITLLAFVGRAVLTEQITVKLDGIQTIDIYADSESEEEIN